MNRYNSIRINGEVYGPENLNHLLNHFRDEVDTKWIFEIHEFLTQWFSPLPDLEIKTSGSSGNPKIIHVKKDAMVHSAKATQLFFDLKETDAGLLCLPASYIAGKMMLVRAMVSGFDLYIVKPSANPFLSVQWPVDFIAVTPYQLSHSLETLKRKQIRKVIVGGSQVSAKLEADLQQIPIEFYETYGMTETVSHIALRTLNGVDKSDYFQILPGIEIHTDERSCLVIKAPGLFAGELTTNDIVELIDNVRFKWLGRFDNVINSGGVKIYPEQIEKKIERSVSGNFVITSLPDTHLGEKIVLVIEGMAPETEETERLKEELSHLLNKYEMPKEIRYIPVLPLTETNKILRRNLLEK